MIETKVPKDISVYETKIAGPLTLRQLICLTVSVIIDYLVYVFVLDKFVSPDYYVYIFAMIDVPILAFTFKPMGMKMEVYLKAVLKDNIVRPTKRIAINKLANTSQNPVKKKTKITKKILKEHPEYKAYK